MTYLKNMDTDTAMTVLECALIDCQKIRRDYGWARSDDSPARHAFILRDLETHFVPRCSDPMTATIMRGAIAGERQAFADQYPNG